MWVRKSERGAANQEYVTLSDEKGLCTSKHRDVSPIMMTTTITTSSTAQGGGGSFKNRKPIGEIGCCESGMAERSH